MILNLMNSKIQILKTVTFKRPDGTTRQKTVVFKTLWADVTRATLKEYREITGIAEEKENVIFLVNYMDSRDITEKMFVLFNGEKYNIKDIQRDYERFDCNIIIGRRNTK